MTQLYSDQMRPRHGHAIHSTEARTPALAMNKFSNSFTNQPSNPSRMTERNRGSPPILDKPKKQKNS
ncbi:MAG: hypothetical protein NXH94_09215 [Rhodobacteraceae bacterium]|jgi:hypothetical protein|uniref:hypothetical protein n=1 Tax=Marivita sp. XM-24bin2 TaxID=2133951 RepID=UPI000D7B82A4|nr:hypothetical protein [Marivita sp. XM-24bin2]MCR9109064.1 hypothetical protein [Paracoccaceae bacterium]PWL36948.1 MAG: hypothetical protein DCO97_00010 [Marivita sp. XM-24bin2]